MEIQNVQTEVYIYFLKEIDKENVWNLNQLLSAATQTPALQHVHVAMSLNGGFVSDGLALYSIFRNFPLELTVYNISTVQSIAALAFLGAKNRVVAPWGTFMYHRTTIGASDATAAKLSDLGGYVAMEDERTDAILRNHVTFDEAAWEKLQTRNLYVSPDESVRIGISNIIGQFSPPSGSQVYNA